MDERIMQFRVGIMVIASVIIALILIVLFNDPQRWMRGSYLIHAKFHSVRGVQRDSPVRKNGILIGRVRNVELDPQGGAKVTMAIDEGRTVFKHELCRVRSAFLGDASLEFVQNPGKKPKDEFIQPGETVDGSAAGDPLQAIAELQDDVELLMKTMNKAGNDVSDLAQRMNNLIADNEAQIQSLLKSTEEMVQSVTRTSDTAQRLLGDEEMVEDIKSTIEILPELFADAKDLVGGLNETRALLDQNLENLEGFTRPLGERGEELLAKLDRTVSRADRLFENLTEFSEALNDEEGTLGRLLHDDQLYVSLNRTLSNIEDLSAELKPVLREVRPVISDLRVASDQIARDPFSLGVRGVFKQNVPVKRSLSHQNVHGMP